MKTRFGKQLVQDQKAASKQNKRANVEHKPRDDADDVRTCARKRSPADEVAEVESPGFLPPNLSPRPSRPAGQAWALRPKMEIR